VGFFIAWPLVAATPTRAPAAQIRALWVDGFHPGFRTPQEADQLVADAVAAHLNLLIVQIRRRGDSFYTHSIEPPVEDDPYRPDFDALGYLLEKAHAAGLQVHAWVNVTPIWRGGPLPPLDPKHIFNIHGLNAQGDESWLTQTDTGEKKFSVGYFLDPGHPAAANHIVQVILNIVRNYPVDGIHLDFIRYPEMDGTTEGSGSHVGYNPVSVARFHQRYGGTGLPAPNDPRWSAWRREQVTNLVRRIYLEIHAAKSGVQLSAALVPWGDGPLRRADWPHAHPYWRVFQDWLEWIDLGVLDMAVPMNYDRQSEKRTRAFFEHWIELEKDNKKDRLMTVGLGAYMNTVEDSEAQLKRVQARSSRKKFADGFAVYSYFASSRDSGNGLLLKMAEKPGAAPPLPKATPSKEGSLAGVFPGSDGATVEISRKVGKGWSRPVHVITDGNGFFGATRLKPGVYRVKSGDQTQQVEVTAGTVAFGVR
jgi:uncharacterized lipoprotein YddW (UPF0748 family)